ncbi:unnamed protein product [Schistosoma curassoni]|nr:unnamed protein product [Schistosoma curassoni]
MGNIIDEQGGYDADVKQELQSTNSIRSLKQHIEFKTKLSASQHQIHILQYERQDSSTILSCNFENHHNSHQTFTSIYKQSSTRNTLYLFVGYHPQECIVEENEPPCS